MNLIKTILPNQLNNPSTMESSKTIQGATWTNNGNGTATVNGTVSAGVESFFCLGVINLTSGHKYLYRGCPSGDDGTHYFTAIWDLSSGAETNGIIATSNITGERYFYGCVRNGITVNNIVFKPQLIDLTLLYGQGLEPSTVAQFRADYPLDYYPYSLTNTTGLLTCANGAVTADISSMLPSGMRAKDISTINWTYYAEDTTFEINKTNFDNDFIAVAFNSAPHMLCEKYLNQDYRGWGASCIADKTMGCSDGGWIYIRDDSFNGDVTAFKNANKGVYILYNVSS